MKAKPERCLDHGGELMYFCKTCKKPICPDCAMFGNEHKGHEFERLSNVVDHHVELIKKELNGLKRRLGELSSF